MTISATRATAASVPRFTRVVRAVHWSTTVLMFVCLVTAFALYNGSVSLAIGHRRVVELVHVWCGLALPVPTLLGIASGAYRRDLGHLNRFTPTDWQWLRSKHRRSGAIRVGKFNAGQKVFASLTGGSILVLLGTGILMYWPDLVRLSWRTGATFAHDWFALAVGLLVLGHLYFALKDAEAMRAMRTGVVSIEWATREHRSWVEQEGWDAEVGGGQRGRGREAEDGVDDDPRVD